jgi:hypothetical protein
MIASILDAPFVSPRIGRARRTLSMATARAL